MAKPLSEQLADLSVRAKSAEDAAASARKDAHDKVVALREQSRAAVASAVDKVDREIGSARNKASLAWETLKTKVEADVGALKADIARRKHDRGVARAEDNADDLEWEAGLAIDYAAASIEQARLAVIDAVVARVDAEKAKRA